MNNMNNMNNANNTDTTTFTIEPTKNRTERHILDEAALGRPEHVHALMHGEAAGGAVWLPRQGLGLIVDSNGGECWFDATTARQAARIGAAQTAILIFDEAAQANLDECGILPDDIATDLDLLACDGVTPEQLTETCLHGADEDRVAGWRSYVATLVAALPE